MIHKTLEDAQDTMRILGYDSLEEMYEAEEDPTWESMQWMFARKAVFANNRKNKC